MNKKTEKSTEKKDLNKSTPTENNDEKLKKLEEEITKLKKDKLLLLAEIENKRKDFQKRMEYVYKYGGKKLASCIVNFLVNLEERALKAMRDDLENNPKDKQKELVNKFKDHLTGIEIIKNRLREDLEGEGVKEMKVEVGVEPANIIRHELIEKVENDNLPEGIIIEVVKKGYFFHEEVLLPAKVKITKKSQTS